MNNVDQGYVVGLLGAGIGTSLTPALHHLAADRAGLRYVYKLIDIVELGVSEQAAGRLVREAQRLGFTGINVTHPCKQLLGTELDDLSEDAELIGAVNTVVFRDGAAVGFNTDWIAFEESLRSSLSDVPTGCVVVLGAGGAGAAVAHACVRFGIETVVVIDLIQERAVALAQKLNLGRDADVAHSAGIADLGPLLETADGLIHATPSGGSTSEHELPFAPELLRSHLWVVDIVYRPLETSLLKAARERGCRILDGGEMAALQAAYSFALFTGLLPDRGETLRDFRALAARSDTDGGRPAGSLTPATTRTTRA